MLRNNCTNESSINKMEFVQAIYDIRYASSKYCMLKIVVLLLLIFQQNVNECQQFVSLFQVPKPPSTLGVVSALGHVSRTNTDPLRQLCVS